MDDPGRPASAEVGCVQERGWWWNGSSVSDRGGVRFPPRKSWEQASVICERFLSRRGSVWRRRTRHADLTPAHRVWALWCCQSGPWTLGEALPWMEEPRPVVPLSHRPPLAAGWRRSRQPGRTKLSQIQRRPCSSRCRSLESLRVRQENSGGCNIGPCIRLIKPATIIVIVGTDDGSGREWILRKDSNPGHERSSCRSGALSGPTPVRPRLLDQFVPRRGCLPARTRRRASPEVSMRKEHEEGGGV